MDARINYHGNEMTMKVAKYINVSSLPQYGDLIPALNKDYLPKYSDDLYYGVNTALTHADLAAIHLIK